ncbi:zinc ribbon domain-containing protein [Virgisporangium aurantiacum]|nr:hypothetical protein [Virgisporangium aurantiacum]
MILGTGHTSAAVLTRRQTAGQIKRRGGVDVNVSNLSVVSLPTDSDPDPGERASGLMASRVACARQPDEALTVERLRQRRRNRALQRSRRASNPTQYRLSKRQQRRADRRHAAGLAAVQVMVPGGPRLVDTAGVPVRAYRRDDLSNTYRSLRGRVAVNGAARTAAGRTRARTTAAALVAVHGPDLTVEDSDIRNWARRWGRRLHIFTPGMLLNALKHETEAVTALRRQHLDRAHTTPNSTADAGMHIRVGLVRAGTWHTAWSQHCLCGRRTPKHLRERRHHCPECGLAGDRDLVAALIGAHTTLTDPARPDTARVDWTAARITLDHYGVATINRALDEGLQGALTESTGTHRPDRHRTGARPRRPQRSTAPPATLAGEDGGGVLGELPVRATHPCHSAPGCGPVHPTTPDETRPAKARTTPERRRRTPRTVGQTRNHSGPRQTGLSIGPNIMIRSGIRPRTRHGENQP